MTNRSVFDPEKQIIMHFASFRLRSEKTIPDGPGCR
jgi:hypothetical protein